MGESGRAAGVRVRVRARARVPPRRRDAGAVGSSASTLERLAVLLEAGVAPGAAWGYLTRAAATAAGGEEPGESAGDERRAGEVVILRGVADALARGEPGAGALSRALGSADPSALPLDEWRQTAAAWEVSEASGSPLGSCLRSSAESARALAQARRESSVALSGPVATSRIVLALPLVGLLIGGLLGFDSIGVLVRTPIGWACLLTAGLLAGIAFSWNRALVRRAEPPHGVPGLDLELLAVALSAGGSWPDARRLVATALSNHCAGVTIPTPERTISSIIALSELAGVPGAALLRSEAAELRREARAASAAAAERLGVVLMLPLGVCILPAFLLVGVVPLFVALLSSTGWSS